MLCGTAIHGRLLWANYACVNCFILNWLPERAGGRRVLLLPPIPVPEGEQEGKVNLDDIITHTLPLEQAADGHQIFKQKEDNCVKVVLKP